MIKELKTALQTLGIDTTVLRNWQKLCAKTKKQLPAVTERYQSACNALIEVNTYMSRLEQLMVAGVDWSRNEQKEIQSILKQLKKLENSFHHEFLVSKEDKEFHLIYSTVIKLGIKICNRKEDRLLLKSEIENILALIHEDLEKEKPNLLILSFFYLQHSDSELVNLPPMERVKKISQVYEDVFIRPLCNMLEMAMEKANQLRPELEARKDRKSVRTLSDIEILWVHTNFQLGNKACARQLIEQLIKIS